MSQFKLADNVKETTTTTGTGPVSLAGAFASSFKTFVNGIGSTYLTAYKIDDGAGNWECRYGVIASGTPDTITNAGFISSSSGSAVSFGSGTKTVTCVPMPELVITAAISPVLAETDIASATTTDLGSIQTLRARITGTTTITGFGTSPNSLRFVRFAGALTLTYNATSLITILGASRTTAAGDIGIYVSDGSGNWTEVLYSGAGGTIASPTVAGLLSLTGPSGGQIKFPPVQNSSSDANTLDDYEEGTWTPSDVSGAGLTFTSVSGNYVKIGRMVTVWGALTYPSTADGLGAFIGSLPFTALNSGPAFNVGVMAFNGLPGAGSYFTANQRKNQTDLQLNKNGTSTALKNSDVATFSVTFSVSYQATT